MNNLRFEKIVRFLLALFSTKEGVRLKFDGGAVTERCRATG